MQQAFDTTGYLIARADEDRARIVDLTDEQQHHRAQLHDHESRISFIERSLARFSQVAQLLLPLSALILAGLVALGPAVAVDLAQALIKMVL
jgi:hypothetical protein